MLRRLLLIAISLFLVSQPTTGHAGNERIKESLQTIQDAQGSPRPAMVLAQTGGTGASNEDEDPMARIRGIGRFVPGDPRLPIAQFLLDVKNGKTGEYFYKELGKIGKGNPDVNMLMVNSVKTSIGEIGGDMLLEKFLGARFEGRQGTPVEALIGTYRRDLTLKAVNEVIKNPRIRALAARNNSRVFLAFVGKWASQSPQDFTFSGDIDFSFVGGNAELIIAMRDLFNDIIVRETGGLTMKQLDSFATAHGFATSDVYVGEAGRKYGDDEIAKGKVSLIDFEQGGYELNSHDGSEAIFQSVLEEAVLEARKRGGFTDRTVDVFLENLDARANTMTEPMISMEMIRHLQHDIILHSESFPALDTIVKGCKYLYRSNIYFTKQFGVDPANKALSDFATKITQMAKSASPGDMAAAVTKYFQESGMINSPAEVNYVPGADGRPKAVLASNREKAMAFLQSCMNNMWSNVERGLRIHLEDLKRKKADFEEMTKRDKPDEQTIKDMEAFRKKLSELLKGITTELGEFETGHMEMPSEVKGLCQEVVRISDDIGKITGMRNLTVEEEKQLELIKKLLTGQPAEHTLAMALSTMMDLANKFIQRTNARLDWIDDTLMGHFRGDPSFEEFIRDIYERNKLLADLSKIDDPATRAQLAEFQGTLSNRFRKKTYTLEVALNTAIYQNAVARGVKKINVTLNEFIQSSQSGRAVLSGLTAFNLAQEFSAYTEAFSKDGFSGFSAEIIRRRVPFGSTAESVYQGKYLLAGWTAITTIFPPLGLPEAAYGVVSYATTATVSYAWSSDLELLIDGLYEKATWEEVTTAGVMRFKLTSVTYKDRKYERQSLEKGETFILQPDVDTVLWANLAQGDPFLELFEELQNHPDAGQKVKDNFVRQYEARWLALKKAYVRSMIENLEKRKNAEVASATGQIAKIYDELMGIAVKLEIKDQVIRAMEAEADSDALKTLWGWLKTAKRAAFVQPLPETEKTKAAAVTMKYLDTYRAVLADRGQVEAAVAGVFEKDGRGTPPTEQHRQRILTGMVFLTGRAGDDEETAKLWKALPGALDAAVEQELLSIKAESVEDAKLDTPYDRETHAKVFFEDYWIRALQQMKVPVISAGSVKDAISSRVDARKKLVKDYRDTYALTKGTVTVYVVQQHGSKRTDLPVTNADVSLQGDTKEIILLENRGEGQYTKSGVKPGTYVLTIKAEGFTATADGKKDVASYTIRMPSPKESAKGLDPITVYLIVKDRGKQPLDVSLAPSSAVIKESGEGSTVTLTPIVVPKEDSGKLNYQWAADGKVLRSGQDVSVEEIAPFAFSGQGQSGKDVKVTLVVFDEKDHQGAGQSVVKVVPPGFTVRLNDHRKIINKDESEMIRVEEPRAADESFKYSWKISGDGVGFEKPWSADFMINGREYAGKTLSVTVTVTDKFGSKGQAITSITVKDEDSLAKIPVSISPQSATISEDGQIELTITATPFQDSGQLNFNNVDLPKGTTSYRVTFYGKDTTYAPPVTTSVTVTVRDEKGRTGEAVASIYVTKKGTDAAAVVTDGKKETAPGDPKQQAEAKYRWLKESVAYLEALKEYDRKSYNAFEKSVTSSIVRDFVAKTPPRYEKDFKLPDGPDKELCGETYGDIAGRLKGFDSECWSALNSGCKTIGTRETTRTIDGRQMKILESVTSCEGPCGKAQTCSNVLKAHTGELGYANSLQDYVNEKYIGCLGEAGAANGRHQRELDKKIKDLPESLPYKRYQEFAGLNDWKGYLAAVEKVKQEFGLPDPIPSPIALPWSYSSPCGGAGASPEQPRELQVTLSADKKKLKPGELAGITAAVTGGKPGYTYTWTGNYAGSGSKVTFTSRNPGKQTLSLAVSDAAGAKGNASIEIEVEGIKAAIVGLKDRVVYGTTAALRVQFDAPPDEKAASSATGTERKLPSEEDAQKVWYDTHGRLVKECEAKYRGTLPAKEFYSEKHRAEWMKLSECEEDARTQASKAKSCFIWPDSEGCKDYKPPVPATPKAPTGYRVVWQSEPGITFDPATSDGSTTVLFDRMPSNGKIRIWAQLQKDSGGGIYATVGEAPQQEVTVVPPKFKWTFNPGKGKGRIGQEVRATLTTEPADIKAELLNYEWSWPESSGRMEYEKNASVIGFVPKDARPVKLLVAPKVPFHREPVGGGLLEEYQAEGFAVTVTEPKQMGPAPQVWKEGVGLVDVQREIAVFQNMSMRAEVAPDPEKKPLRYQWIVTPGGCTIGNDVNQEVTVSCSQTGSFQAKVTVRDRDGAELGSGTGTISVTISQNEITKAKDRKKELEEKLAKARALRQEGKFDEAITLVDDVLKIDPKREEAKQFLAQLKKEKADADKKIAGVNADIDNAKFDEAERELKPLKASCPQYPPVQAAEKKLAAERQKAQGKAGAELARVSEAVKAREFKQALALAAEIRKTAKLSAKQDSELAGLERTARDQEAKKERARQLLVSGEAKLKNHDYDGALADLASGLAASQGLWSAADSEPARFGTMKTEAQTKAKRLKELLPVLRLAAEGKPVPPADALKKALTAADEAQALQPANGAIAGYRKLIEQRLAAGEKESERIKAARQMRDKGETAQKQGKIAEAVSCYRESLKLLPDAALEAHVKTLEARLAQDKANVETAKKLRAEGETLQSQGRLTEAAAKMRESLKYAPDPALEAHVKTLEARLAEDKGKIEAAKKLRAEGETLQRQGKTAEAAAKYRESLKYVPDAKLEEHVRMLEAQAAKQAEQRKTADQLWQEGTALFNQGRPGDSLAKFKESLGYWSDASRSKYVKDLEARKAKAAALKGEGSKLEGQNRIPDAVSRYRASLNSWPDPELSSRIAMLEEKLKQDADTAARKARAKKLRDEGYALQQKKQLQAAVGKYRESLAIWPDKQLEDHIRQLEAKMAAVPPTKPTTPGGAGSVPSLDILTSKVWQFGRSDGTVLASRMKLMPGGRIEGATHANESRWSVAGNELLFYDSSGKVSTRYNTFRQEGGRWVISGPFLLWGDITHVLRETAEGGTPPATTPVGTPPTSPPATTSQTSAAQSAGGKTLFDNRNTSGVYNNPTRATVFTLREPHVVTSIQNYHWNSGKGATPGTIALQGSDGRTYGPWKATGSPGQGGVPHAYWNVAPNVTVPAGTYTVVDSGPASWAQNPGSQGCGHTRVEGYPVSGTAASAPVTTSSPSATSIQAELTNRSRENAHIFTEGETFGPDNRLAPGEKRRMMVIMKSDGSVTFKAGRNGQVMATKTWRGIPGDSSRVPVVVFDESNPYDKLTVTTGLR